MSLAPQRLIDKGHELERAGKHAEALEIYRKAGALQDAARVFALLGRFEDAGNLLLGSLAVTPAEVRRLQGADRKLAYLAATYFAKSHSVRQAADIFIGLGEHEKAAELLERQGDHAGAKRARESKLGAGASLADTGTHGRALGGEAISRDTARRLERDGKHEAAIEAYVQLKLFGEAARLLFALHRVPEAAALYAEAGLPFEAAACYLKAGDTGKGLENLMRVPRSDPRYRSVATHAIKLIAKLGIFNFQLEHFISPLIASGPENPDEVEVFFLLSQVYERHNLPRNAAESLRKLLAHAPEHERARAALAVFERAEASPSAIHERIQQEDSKFLAGRQPSAATAGHRTQGEFPELAHAAPATQVGLGQRSQPPPQVPASTGMPNGATLPSMDPGALSAEERETDPLGDSAIAVPLLPQHDPETVFTPGAMVAERYRLVARIGTGGMSIVFKAHDLELDDTIVLKVFLQQVRDPRLYAESLARFRQELKLSRQLIHPNLIRLYDIGMFMGHRYISMELLVGQTLDELLQGPPVAFDQGLDLLVQAATGLQVAHALGIVHRDIKPENLFVTETGVVKVMDFGIAKNQMVKGMTMEGVTAGTPHYMAPEQISDFSNVGVGADLYALGVIMYQMFTGVLPFDCDDLNQLLMCHISAAPTPPRIHRPELPEELEQIILKLLEKKPQLRFASCDELANKLRRQRARLRSDEQ